MHNSIGVIAKMDYAMKKAAASQATEHQEQVALFQWAALSGISELRLMFAIPNGGHRHVAVAAKLKAEGVKPGIPDIFLPVADDYRGHIGLWIEMKSAKGRATPIQKQWHADLQQQGYCVAVCHGWQEAQKAILIYLGRIAE